MSPHSYTVAYLEDRVPSVARQLACHQSDIGNILDHVDGHDEESILDAVELLGIDAELVQSYLDGHYSIQGAA